MRVLLGLPLFKWSFVPLLKVRTGKQCAQFLSDYDASIITYTDTKTQQIYRREVL
jgi:hypothetical protein